MRRTLALLGVTALILTACEAPAVYGPSPTPTVPPIFESEEEAEAAAADLLGQYAEAVSRFYASAGEHEQALRDLTSPAQFDDEVDSLASQTADGLTFTGSFSTFGIELQQLHQNADGTASIQAYVCVDYRQSQYTRPDGTSYEGEVDWAPFEAIVTATSRADLTLEELRHWTGRDFCEPSV